MYGYQGGGRGGWIDSVDSLQQVGGARRSLGLFQSFWDHPVLPFTPFVSFLRLKVPTSLELPPVEAFKSGSELAALIFPALGWSSVLAVFSKVGGGKRKRLTEWITPLLAKTSAHSTYQFTENLDMYLARSSTYDSGKTYQSSFIADLGTTHTTLLWGWESVYSFRQASTLAPCSPLQGKQNRVCRDLPKYPCSDFMAIGYLSMMEIGPQ